MIDFQAVIFDMDGVIVDSEKHHEHAFYGVLHELGFDGPGSLKFADYVGRSEFELWGEFIARNKPVQTLDELLALKRQKVVDAMREHQPVFEEIPGLVEKLAARGPLAIASGSERTVIETVLSLKGLRRFFSAVVSCTDVTRGKPAPDIFLRAAELLKVAPQDCVVIEDSKPGVVAGLAAGMKVIAITNTYPAAELRQATHVARTYAEIEQLLMPDRP